MDARRKTRRTVAWAAVLLLAALSAFGCARAPNDAQLATTIKARMFSDPVLKGTALRVAVKDGVATLSGEVRSISVRYEAFKVATETPGVRKVTDDMTVALPKMGNPVTSAGTAPAKRHRERHRRARRRTAPASGAAAAMNGASSAAGESASAENATAQTTSDQNTPAASAQPVLAGEPGANQAPAIAAPPPAQHVTIPDGTPVSVQMIDTISSSVNHTGDIFHGELAKPLLVDKRMVAPAGTNMYLKLVEARSAGHISGQSELRVELYQLELHGRSYALVSNDYIVKGVKRKKRSALAIIGGAALGAAIGAIAGGGKGAAIGAAAGGGGGAVYQEVTKGKAVTISSESTIHFVLQAPVEVTVPAATSAPSGTGEAAQNPQP